MTFVPFELERWQSAWENRVRINLSESGVHPLSIQELLVLSGGDRSALGKIPLGYSQSNGTDDLRAAIAALYPGATGYALSAPPTRTRSHTWTPCATRWGWLGGRASRKSRS